MTLSLSWEKQKTSSEAAFLQETPVFLGDLYDNAREIHYVLLKSKTGTT